MNKFIILEILVALLANASVASPILLEKSYTNYAFGYQNKGCLVDENGYAYTYSTDSGYPITLSSTRPKLADIDTVKTLLSQAAAGEFAESRVMYDAGATRWSGTYNGKSVNLKLEGDFKAMNSTSAAKQLVDIIDRVCK